ncbi:MAG: hypothetical protein ACYCYF_06600 [Anaerolineae bacterium]
MDTMFSALRVGAVAVTLALAVLIGGDAIGVFGSSQSPQTFALEMAADSGPAEEGAGGGPGVLREAPVGREAVPGDGPVLTSAVEQVEALAAAEAAESASETAAEEVAAPEALSLMAAPVAEGTASPDGPESESLSAAEDATVEAVALAVESPVEAQAEMASSEQPGNTAQPDVMAKAPGVAEPPSQKTAVEDRPLPWTTARVAAAVLAAVLATLLGALFWIGRRRVSL